MATTTEPHVLIIGAGITGLVLAHGLQKANIPFTIFEAEEPSRWRRKEWSMGLHWSLPLLEDLLPADLKARVDTDGAVDPDLDWTARANRGAGIWDGVNGTLLKDLTAEGKNIRVSRQRLRKLLQERIEVQWEHSLQDIIIGYDSSTVKVTFTNGKHYTGTLLIGADGPRSTVRNYLFNHDLAISSARIPNDQVSLTATVSYDADTARLVRSPHPVWSLIISPELFMFQCVQQASDPARPETWTFFIMVCWLGRRDDGLDYAGRLKEIKERGGQLAEPFRTTLLAIPDETQFQYADISYWIAIPWDTRDGLVTLAGDAAHPMPPYRGQGCNHAIQDAHHLVNTISQIAAAPEADRTSLQATLIQNRSDEIAKRGAEETQLSVKNGYMCMSYSQFKESPYMKQGLSRGAS